MSATHQTKLKRIRLLLVDDHSVVRLGLRAALAKAPQIEVVGEAASAQEAVAEAERLKPDLVLMDVRMPGGSGFEACRQIQRMAGAPRVLFLTAFSDDETIKEGIAAGAEGYLLKDVEPEKLAQAIKDVIGGQSVLDPSITGRVMDFVRSPVPITDKDKLDRLSAQERRVLTLVAQGKTNKEIAVELGLSDKTVKNYFSNTLDKLGFNRRTQAATFFVQHTLAK